MDDEDHHELDRMREKIDKFTFAKEMKKAECDRLSESIQIWLTIEENITFTKNEYEEMMGRGVRTLAPRPY